MSKIIIRETSVTALFRWKLYNVIISYVPSIKLHWYKIPEEEEEKLSNIRKYRTEILITFQSDLEDSSPQKKIDESLLFSFMTPTRPLLDVGLCLVMQLDRKWQCTLVSLVLNLHILHLYCKENNNFLYKT